MTARLQPVFDEWDRRRADDEKARKRKRMNATYHPDDWTPGMVIIHPNGTRRTLLYRWVTESVHPGWAFQEGGGMAIWQLVMEDWRSEPEPRLPLSVREVLRVARKYAVAQHGMPLAQIDEAERWIVAVREVEE